MKEMIQIEPIVDKLLPLINQGNKRLCHKVRTARYYDGVATIDVVGCYLDCCFCWVPEFKRFPEEVENRIKNFKYMSPLETSQILIDVARENALKSVRLSGGEPTLNPQHLIETVRLTTEAGFNFVFETNGLLLDEEIVKNLAKYQKKMLVYFGLKGSSPDMFYRMTERDPKYWRNALNGLKLLIENDFTIGINVMTDFLDEKEFLQLIPELVKINKYTPLALDIKKTSIFPHVRERLSKRMINFTSARIDKKAFDNLMIKHYPEIIKEGNSYRIDIGMMNFFDFEKANNQTAI
jgi:uncharacterized Fe-S cluster-containing radical SAM superfamily protein